MQRSGQTAKTQKLRQIPWKPTALTSAKLREKQNAPMRKTPSGQRLIKPGGGRGVNSGGGAAPRPAAPDGGIPGARTADGTLSAFAPRALRNGTATLRGTSESFSGRGTCRQHPTHTPAAASHPRSGSGIPPPPRLAAPRDAKEGEKEEGAAAERSHPRQTARRGEGGRGTKPRDPTAQTSAAAEPRPGRERGRRDPRRQPAVAARPDNPARCGGCEGESRGGTGRGGGRGSRGGISTCDTNGTSVCSTERVRISRPASAPSPDEDDEETPLLLHGDVAIARDPTATPPHRRRGRHPPLPDNSAPADRRSVPPPHPHPAPLPRPPRAPLPCRGARRCRARALSLPPSLSLPQPPSRPLPRPSGRDLKRQRPVSALYRRPPPPLERRRVNRERSPPPPRRVSPSLPLAPGRQAGRRAEGPCAGREVGLGAG